MIDMTRANQKLDERRFAEETARLLGTEWNLVTREDESDGGPDFIVYDGTKKFGLEVLELFKGKVNGADGATLKSEQSLTQQVIDRIRQRYEELERNVPLYVKFLGDVREEHSNSIIQTLIDMGLREKEFPYHEDHVLRQDSDSLKIFVSRLPAGWPADRLLRPDWFSISDSGGWVDTSAHMIPLAVKVKSKKIDKYRQNVAKEMGFHRLDDADVRLLLVADRMWKYGQISPDRETIQDLHGFTAVYFLSFPEKAAILQVE